MHAQELQAPDVGHLVPAAGTANFGVTAMAAIHEPVADTASETPRRTTGSSLLHSPPADAAITANRERPGASVYQNPSNDGVENVEAAASSAAVLSPDARLADTAGSTPQHTISAAGREPQRPVVSGALPVWQLADARDH